MITRDEAFLQYEDSLASIDKQAQGSKEMARGILQGQLRIIREALHEELKAVRAIQQKTKRR